jgi:hypothetical protein
MGAIAQSGIFNMLIGACVIIRRSIRESDK